MFDEISQNASATPRNMSHVPFSDFEIRSGRMVPIVATGPMVPMDWAKFSMPDR
jgi:hypothetical protein